MHHSDVVSIAQNNVEINRVLSKTWKYILNRRTRRFFLFIFFMARYGGLFLFPRHARGISNNTTQKVSAGAFDGVFFTGRWWPFFIYRRKTYV
ncbi:hypothetical protein OC481_004747 [Escherichia coli]|nr:hypothetical protein [Escherichia coli]